MIIIVKKYRIGIILLAVATFIIGLSIYLIISRSPGNKQSIPVTASSNQQNSTAVATSKISWILQNHFLSLVEDNKDASTVFSTANKIYAILSTKEASTSAFRVTKQYNIVPTVYYNSYAKFVSDYNNGMINSTVKAVLFDDSANTPATVVPTIEADNPLQFDQSLTTFAHQHGMISMCDFILGIRAHNKTGTAPPCDITVLNYSQQSERIANKYNSIVAKAVAIIKNTNPKEPVFVGLSTNPRGPSITTKQLLSAYNATKQEVSGYWISIPTSGGIGCPNCSKQNPALLPAFLQAIFIENNNKKT